ncbi:hypothetical protein MKX01_005773 [Papaver californicum]|nr:hypothetical protein MKX01_005773 [Papaver californicum]
MDVVDVAFIQPIEHRPKSNFIGKAVEIPLIDRFPSAYKIATKIGSVCKEWGFFHVIIHGVPFDLQQRVEVAVKKFFGLPSEEKRKVQRDEVNPLGYYDTEYTKNIRDWKEVFDFMVKDPTVIPASHELHDNKLQELRNKRPDYPLELSLGLLDKRLKGYFNHKNTSFIRLKHYPPCPAPHLALGVWTNDKYESPEHKVMVNSKKDMFSIPFSLNPAHDVMIKPLDEFISTKNPSKYKEYNWGKFLKKGRLSNFKKLDVETLQIHHFKRSG